MSDIKKIAKHYLKGSCIFDLLANIPFEILFGYEGEKSRLYRLFKLLRVPRLFELLNVDQIKSRLKDIYSNRLMKAMKNVNQNYKYPILD